MNFAFTFLSLAIFPLALFIFWTLSATGPSSPLGRGFPTLTNKRICLLIAHPDDEAMFFAPTLLALTKPELGNHVKILCLSSGMWSLLMAVDSASGWFLIYQITGDAAGLGHIRKQELQKSALRLGLRNEPDVFIVDDPSRFPDSMTATWSEENVSGLLASAFAPQLAAQASSQSAPMATIDILLTFDQSGVSYHPNHRSLYHGARAFLKALMRGNSNHPCQIC